MPRALAVDVGGSKLAAAVVELPEGRGDPVISHRRTVPTPAHDGGPAVLAAVTALARLVLADAGARSDAAAADKRVATVGVASAGTVRPGDGVITHATGILPGWAGTSLGEHLRRELRLPVTVINDVHAHGVGEALHGAGRGHRTVLVVAVGTGIGGALVVDGEPVVGAHGAAGHVGHLPVPEAAGLPCTCGRAGHLEGLASGHGLRAAHRARTGQDLPGREVVALAAGGDEGARTLLVAAARATGRAVGALLNVLDPDVVVVGGGLATAPEPWPTALREGVALEAMDPVAPTPVLLSGAGADAALVGAAHVALTRAHDARVHDIP